MKNETIYSYLIEDKKNNLYKIGRSKNPINRFNSIKTSNPFVELIGVSFIDEKYLHSVYFKYRIIGEWFNFSNEIKDEVFKLFKPINKISEKNKDYILHDYFINEFVILNEFLILEEQKNYRAILDLSSLIFEKIGSQNFKELFFKKDNDLNRILASSMHMNL